MALSVGEVFVPGGLPSATYNPREPLRLEERLFDYLAERHKILSLSGPTKCGKTVLLRRVVKGAIWVSGGSVTTAAEFWAAVVDRLGAYTDEEAERSSGQTSDVSAEFKAGIAVPGVAEVGGGMGKVDSTTAGRRSMQGRSRLPLNVAAGELRKRNTPLVVDDFHYIDPAVQLAIVRALKDLVFDGVPVIFASVPHRAFDAVRVEKEMTGRVEQIQIDFWSREELEGIAIRGFDALNIEVSADVRLRLADESFRSPHLMQDFCLQLCKANGIREQADDGQMRLVDAPDDWDKFFRDRAGTASKSAFDLLATGPRQRSDRIQRVLKTGRETDIYGAVLAAIAATGPLTELTYTDLRSSLRDVLQSEPPQRHEVTRVLEEMTKIAREKIEGEPVVDYDEELSTLYISDPFFAYFLRWGMNGDN